MQRSFAPGPKSRFIWLALIAVSLFAPICASGARAATPVATDERAASVVGSLTSPKTTPLIPRRLLFGNPDKINVTISPDGRFLAYAAPVEKEFAVWVGPIDDPQAARPVTRRAYGGVAHYFWTHTGNHIAYLRDRYGDERAHLFSVALDTGEIWDLTPTAGVQARIYGISHKFPDELLVGLNNRDPRYHEIYRINIKTGERRLVQKNGRFSSFITDEDFNVRFATRTTRDGGSEILRPTAAGGWEPFAKIPLADVKTSGFFGFDRTGRVLYQSDSRGRDTSALTALNLDTGEQSVIAADARADAGGVMVHPTKRTLQAVSFEYEHVEWRILDDSIAPDFEYLRAVGDGDFKVISQTPDGSIWIVVYIVDDGPARYYRYDRARKEATFLFTHSKALEGLPLAKLRPVVIKSRDGLDLVSYYMLPVGSDKASAGRPAQPLPMVLMVHGGPWSRDTWGYCALCQFLANRGYAVLRVNFRGSTGFGKAFVNAANLEWGAKMHDDLIDAVRWAIKQGIADPERVAIYGGSYGGYATLVGLTFTSDTFACGVDVVGPSNLITLLNSLPAYWKPEIEQMVRRMGDHRTEKGRAFLRERSPLTHVERIRKPLLIGHGANDPRVKRAEAEQIVRAMLKRNLPVTYVLYPDEGHGFNRPQNKRSFLAVAEAFLAKCLGGRHEPVGDDFRGSSITVPVGAEHIPGLVEAFMQSR